MTQPKPLRVRLFHDYDLDHKQVVGHWFLRPVQSDRAEGWKLSFWHPEYSWKDRRAESGNGYEQAMWVFVSTFYDLAEFKYRDYLTARQKVDQAVKAEKAGLLKPRPGFRSGFTRQLRQQLERDWAGWRKHFLQSTQSYYRDATEVCGWPEVEIPTMPWETMFVLESPGGAA